MKTIKVRDLRGSTLEELGRAGELVGVTRDRALIAVIVPMLQAWVEHMVDHNWSQVLRSASAAEVDLGPEETRNLVTLDGALWRYSMQEAGPTHDDDLNPTPLADSSLKPCDDRDREASGQVQGASPSDMLGQLSHALGLNGTLGGPSNTVTVRVGDLTAKRIDQANDDRQLLALTNDGMLIGIVVPVSQKIVQFLVSQNLSRVIYNIQRAEKHVDEEVEFATLDDVLSPDPLLDDPSGNNVERSFRFKRA